MDGLGIVEHHFLSLFVVTRLINAVIGTLNLIVRLRDSNQELRPIHRERSFWFWASVPLEGNCCAHVLIETRRVTSVP